MPLRRRLPLITVLALWTALLGLATYQLAAAEFTRWTHEFEENVTSITNDVRGRLQASETVLNGLAAFLQAVDDDDRRLAARYAAATAAASPHIYMVEVARRVPLPERGAFEAAMRARWRTDFTVKNFATMAQRPPPPGERSGVTWPIVFMHPERPEADAIYGVALETVDNLVHTLEAAHRTGQPAASPRFPLYEGGEAFILLQTVHRPATRTGAHPSGRQSGLQPGLFGRSMVAMLVIRTDALFPVQPTTHDHGRIRYQAVMAVPGMRHNVLFDTLAALPAGIDGLLLPQLQRTTTIDSPAQRTELHFRQQLRWSELATRDNLALLGLLAIGLLVVPWLAVRHFESVDRAAVAHERAAYLATHDPLTGLPNRFLFLDRFQQAVRHWQRSNAPFAILLIDLDGFKAVNDRHGHDTGDQVLRVTSIRMQDLLRANDTVARYGGDEFVVLLSAVGSAEDARLIGEKLLASISAPIGTAAGQVAVSCSIGIALCPLHGSSLDILRQKADQAMYHAKRSGKAAVAVCPEAAPSVV